jgi:hypothetical protein
MNARPHFHLLLSALLLCACSGCTKEPIPAPDFSSYPQTKSFKHYLSFHAYSTGNLVVISSFPSGARFAVQYFVTLSGEESDRRDVYNWAIQDSHNKQLSEAEIKGLRSAILKLPAGIKSPQIEHLVIVSSLEGTDWVTRTYDSDALPKAMQQIYEIIGERFESKKAK